MKKDMCWALVIIFLNLSAHSQGLQPNLRGTQSAINNEPNLKVELLVFNYHLQSNVNDLFLGIKKQGKGFSLWSYAGASKASFIQTTQIQLGSQIQLGKQTSLSHEIIFNREKFPENHPLLLWQSNSAIEYTHSFFHFQYLHRWQWNNQQHTKDYWPNQCFHILLKTSSRHHLLVDLWQFDALPTQLLIQHRILLNSTWELGWGLQWPKNKYWVVLKNNRRKLQSTFCITAQPYFLPSLYQWHEINKD